MKYRSDIDGMRCLAVLSVILFHLNSSVLPGGFTGVDIFFVISGFLITGIITDGVRANRFSMVQFYARRMRRIFPALFTVLFCTSLVAVVAFEPDMYQRFFEELRYASIQASNFLFSQEAGYFDAGNAKSPLLHTWSLGVEEQFYLVWPLLILTVSRFWKNKLASILFGLTLISFIYSEYLCSKSPQTAFYMLQSRAWELGFGGILAAANMPEIKSKLLNNILSLIGLFLISLSFFAVNEANPFPGRYALLPVVGSFLILYTGKSCNTLVFKFLSLKPLVAIGAISYSLYLWHWPLIIFYKTINGGEITFAAGIVLFTATVCLSILSYYFIERPCRYGRFPHSIISAYERVIGQKTQFGKACFYLSLLIVIPAFLAFAVFSSTELENNKSITTVKIDVELLKSQNKPNAEQISLYWGNQNSEYSERNCSSLAFLPANLLQGTHYQFQFKLPDLNQVKGIRLDPLRDAGAIKISNISLTGGLFNRSSKIDMATVQKSIGDIPANVKISFTEDSLLVESSGNDPHFILFKDDPTSFHDKGILFCIFLLVALLSLITLQCIYRGHEHKAVLAMGMAVIVLTILSSARLQYSNYSQWRFLDNANADLWLSAAPMTDTSKFPKHDIPDVLLLGDSHAQHYAGPLKNWCDKRGLTLGIVAYPACPPIFYNVLKNNDPVPLKGQFISCTECYDKQIDHILHNQKTKFVFFAFRQEFYMANPDLFFTAKTLKSLSDNATAEDIIKTSFIDTVKALQNAGKKTVILGQVPVLKERPKTCLSRNVTLLSPFYGVKQSCDIDTDYSDQKLASGKSLFQMIENTIPDVYYFEPNKYVKTIFGSNNTILYFDDNHLNALGSKLLSPFFEHDLSQAYPVGNSHAGLD